jgi:hypothetical protein
MVDRDAMRAERAQIAERLDQVGLALPVAADEQVGAGLEVQFRGCVIAKIREAQMRDSHVSSCVR